MNTKHHKTVEDDDVDFAVKPGAPICYYAVRSGGSVSKFAGRVIKAARDAAEHVDLEFEFPSGAAIQIRSASGVRRGAGPMDAPCWTP